MSKKSPKKILWIALALLILVGGGGFAYYSVIYLPAQTPDEPEIQTATVRQGDLVIYASGSGTLIAADEIDLSFRSSGELMDLLVEVGDEVEAGQLLAQLNDTSAQIQLAQAELNLRELTSPSAIASAHQVVTNTQQEVNDCRKYLAYLISPYVLKWEEKFAAAKLALAEAEASSTEDTQRVVEEAKAELKNAEANLAHSKYIYQEEYIPETFTFSYFDTETRKEVEYLDIPTDIEIDEARVSVELAEAKLIEAEALLAALTGAEVPVDASGPGLAQLEKARLSLQTTQLNLDATHLLSPISGTVTSITSHIGEMVGTAPFITITDLSQPYLEIFLDETDLDKIDLDYQVEVIFDALPDDVITGHVVQLDPSLIKSGNVSTVRGLVKLDKSSLADLDNLLIGMNAAVDVIGGKSEGVVLAPVEALHELSPGEYAVFVMEDGEPKLRLVEVGLMDFTFAEIKSGLKVGEVVTTGIVETD